MGRLITVSILGILLVLLFGGQLIELYIDLLWYGSVGYREVLLTGLQARVVLFFIGAAAFLLLFLPQLSLARGIARRVLRRAPVRITPLSERQGPFGSLFGGGPGAPPGPFSELSASLGGAETARWVLERVSGPLVVAIGAGLALVMGLSASALWETALRARHATAFGVADPIFGYDAGFFIFTLPAIHALQSWLFWALALTTAAVAAFYLLAVYALDPSLEDAWYYFNSRARAMRTHTLLLLASLAALVAVGIWLGAYDIVLARHERIVGANFTDLHARLPATRALAVTAAIGAMLTAITALRRDYGLMLISAGLFAVVLLVGRGALPAIVQRLQVNPAELEREAPYLAHHIAFTRQAFKLAGMTEISFPAEEAVRPEDLRPNRSSLINIRLWDHRPLRDTYNQIQTIRPYYQFADVDVDRYRIDGVYRQVMLGARELNLDRLGAQAQTWVNRRLQYTHGYGVAMSPVNEFTIEGLPTFFIQDLPPTGRLRVERPEIYYGELTASYVIVNTNAEEFDYPRGEENVFTTYQGQGGVFVGPIWQRMALAWYFADFNFLVSTYLRPDSRVLFYRTIKDRAQRIAHFLKLDNDPYLVVADGQLFWMLDAYTITDRYPYSQRVVERLGGAPAATTAPAPAAGQAPATAPAATDAGFFRRIAYNYIRNSAKIVVNAYDGTMRVYLADADDPIARTYASIYPTLFRPLSEMPASLREHVRYPEDFFRVQAHILRTYHVQDARIFYNGEDVWGVATETYVDRRAPVEPYYVIMRLPGQTQEEFLLMLPFTPINRDNMVAWLAARNDGAAYGELVVVRYPRDRLIYGPGQIDARIDQNPIISQQLTLWNQQGSRVIRGNMLVIPIGSSTLYVEPIYLQAETSRLPELKRVVMATGNRLTMEETMDLALLRLFGVDLGLGLSGEAAAGMAPSGSVGPVLPGSAAGAAPSGQPLSAPAAAAARAARESYDRALEALRAGDFARFGEELRNLDERLRELESATGAPP